MQIKCDYCGSMIDETCKTCPHCGGTLSGVNRTAGGQPKTIAELQQWYVSMNLPPDYITRFFIGKDIREPKAFGIYQNGNGDFVVYKNKSSGERVIRYQGRDEAYAVNELYQRLRAEIADQKLASGYNMPPPGSPPRMNGSRRKGRIPDVWKRRIIPIILIILAIALPARCGMAKSILYNTGISNAINSVIYDSGGSSWFDDDDDGGSWFGDDDSGSSWFDDNDDWDWDSDSSWDSSDNWDSGGTDWDSDW